MTLHSRLAALTAAILLPLALALPGAALAHEGLHLKDPFARVTPQAGAVYLLIENQAAQDDRLLAAKSDAAAMVMPMTTEAKADGAMVMIDQPDGFVIPAGGIFLLEPGHAHLMLMGLKAPLKKGDTVTLTLTFANSGDVTLTVPVMPTRTTAPGDADTPYDAETVNDGQTHGAAGTSMDGMSMDGTAGGAGN